MMPGLRVAPGLDGPNQRRYVHATMPFDTLTATQASHRPRHPTPFQQAVELQRRIVEQTQDGEVTAAGLSQLARAWSELEERKRVLRMKPAPKPIDVSQSQGKPKRKPNAAPSFEEK